MPIHPCVACGSNWDEEVCTTESHCTECDHAHTHAGCKECPCQRCPGCGHVHAGHEPFEGQETGFQN